MQLEQARLERLVRVGERGFDGPVLARIERFDLFLALRNHAQCGRLHATGRQATLHLAPQHGRQVEAHQIIQRTARLLRIHQIHRQLARFRDGCLDGLWRDFRKHDAMNALAFNQATLAQDLGDVPGNRFTLAIQIGRQIERFGFGSRFGDGRNVFLVALDHLVIHVEVAGSIDRALLRHQVANMAVRSEDQEVLAEVLVDRLGFRRRLNDEEILGHAAVLAA